MTTGHGLQPGDLGPPFPDNVQKWLSTHFGEGKNGHNGIDWAVHPGTPICAMYDGRIERVNNSFVRGAFPYQLIGITYGQGYGNFVRIHRVLLQPMKVALRWCTPICPRCSWQKGSS